MNDLADATRAVGAERALVSIVIPFYRQGQYLRECVESALAQSHPPVEVIIVDDGSPEPATQFVSEIDRVRIIRQANGGVSAARNTGLVAARGEFIIFLDADDVLYPNALELGLNALAAAPWAGLAFGRVELIDSYGLPLQHQPPMRTSLQRVSHDDMLRACRIPCPGAAIFRRAALGSNLKFDEGRSYAEDYDLYLRFMKKHGILAHPHLVTHYRKHPVSASHRIAEMHAGVRSLLRREIAHFHDAPGLKLAARAGIKRVDDWLLPSILLEDVKSAVGEGEYHRAFRTALVLAFRFPHFFAENAGRKLRLALRSRLSRRNPEGKPGGEPETPGESPTGS